MCFVFFGVFERHLDWCQIAVLVVVLWVIFQVSLPQSWLLSPVAQAVDQMAERTSLLIGVVAVLWLFGRAPQNGHDSSSVASSSLEHHSTSPPAHRRVPESVLVGVDVTASGRTVVRAFQLHTSLGQQHPSSQDRLALQQQHAPASPSSPGVSVTTVNHMPTPLALAVDTVASVHPLEIVATAT